MARKKEGKDADAAVWQTPEFKNLSEALTQVLKVPKAEIGRREAIWKSTKSNPNSSTTSSSGA